MLIYQVKITVQSNVETEWIEWMQRVHVPDVIATGLVQSYQILRPKDKEPHTYYFQYIFDDPANFSRYENEHAARLRADPMEKFPDQFSAERTIFERI